MTDFGMARNANQDDIYTRKTRVSEKKMVWLVINCHLHHRGELIRLQHIVTYFNNISDML